MIPQRHRGLAVAWLACTMLAACTSAPHSDRAMLVAPTTFSDAYTQVNLRLRLATSLDLREECDRAGCIESVQFDERVARIGLQLAALAYEKYPELAQRVPAFRFSVVDKVEAGTASTAGGDIVVLRPVSTIARSDEALRFVIAREMGHVVSQHHEENTGTSLAVSLVATVLAPVTAVVKYLASFYSGVTTAMASASVTAASFASSQVLIASYRPRQLDEADRIAQELLASSGVTPQDAVAGFSHAELQVQEARWMRELRQSVSNLNARIAALPADQATRR